jgi:hypothetical protein
MKKQATVHRSSRIPESETATSTFPNPAMTDSQPKGVFDHDQMRPTHINKGAAESHTKPVDTGRSGSTGAGKKIP